MRWHVTGRSWNASKFYSDALSISAPRSLLSAAVVPVHNRRSRRAKRLTRTCLRSPIIFHEQRGYVSSGCSTALDTMLIGAGIGSHNEFSAATSIASRRASSDRFPATRNSRKKAQKTQKGKTHSRQKEQQARKKETPPPVRL